MGTFSRTSMIALLYRVSRFWRMIVWLSSDPRSRVWFHVPRRTPAARRANMRSDSARLKFRTLTAIVDIVGSNRCRGTEAGAVIHGRRGESAEQSRFRGLELGVAQQAL